MNFELIEALAFRAIKEASIDGTLTEGFLLGVTTMVENVENWMTTMEPEPVVVMRSEAPKRERNMEFESSITEDQKRGIEELADRIFEDEPASPKRRGRTKKEVNTDE